MRGKLADSIFLHVIPPVGSALVRFVGATWRYTVLHQEEIEKARTVGNAVLYALWHGRMLPPVHFYRDHSICALVSQHRDGEFASRVANKLGHDTVRGSSTRGGAKGFNELLRKIESGLDAAILPDGPNGPACQVQPGIIHLARYSGCPIVPITAGASSSFRLKSWDRFLIPKPFSRCVIVFGQAIVLSPQATPEIMEEKRKELENRLNQITCEADAFFHREMRSTNHKA